MENVTKLKGYEAFMKNCEQGGLAATFDLAAFDLYLIAPVKKSVNHSKTLTSMREVQRGGSIAISFPESALP